MIRPGLAKAAIPKLVTARRELHVRSPDGRLRELFDTADVVSEGDVVCEGDGRAWYGSTSIILTAADAVSPELLAEVARRSVHVRLRAMRTALREASLRAPARLGRLVCEVRISTVSGAVRIDVDVQAPLIERRAGASRATR